MWLSLNHFSDLLRALVACVQWAWWKVERFVTWAAGPTLIQTIMTSRTHWLRWEVEYPSTSAPRTAPVAAFRSPESSWRAPATVDTHTAVRDGVSVCRFCHNTQLNFYKIHVTWLFGLLMCRHMRNFTNWRISDSQKFILERLHRNDQRWHR